MCKIGDNNTSTEISSRIAELFSEYWREVHPFLVAFTNRNSGDSHPLHIAIANEIRMMNDHIARCFARDITDEQINKELTKAEAHLQRLEYDTYKQMYWILYDESIKVVEGKNKKFSKHEMMKGWVSLPWKADYYRIKDEANNIALEAKMKESLGYPREDVLPLFKNGYDKYRELEDLIKNNRKDLKKIRLCFYWNSIYPVITTIVLFVLGLLLPSLIKSILCLTAV